MKFFQKSTLLLIVLSFTVIRISAQNNLEKGYVFVENNFKNDNGVIVKWLAGKLYYQKGFVLYKREKGKEWKKVSQSPFQVKPGLDEAFFSGSKQAQHMYDMVQNEPYDSIQGSILQGLALIKIIENPIFAEAMGMMFFDNDVKKGASYQYKIEGIFADGKTEAINESVEFTVGDYSPQKPPSEIKTKRKKSFVSFVWKPEPLRYFSVNVYKSVENGEYVKVNEAPLTPQKNEEGYFPDYFFRDLNIDNKVSYSYKLQGLDFFGQQTEFSEVILEPARDFEGPPAPFVSPSTVASKNTVVLKWIMPNGNDLSDVQGFNVYRVEDPEGENIKTKINPVQLIKSTTSFEHVREDQGRYYYGVSAIDKAGNETFSTTVYIELKDITPPAIPQNLRVSADTGKMNLSWEAATAKDLKGYYVYKSIKGDNYVQVNKEVITATRYQEKIPKNVRNKFSYYVIAVDTNFNYSKPSVNSNGQMPDATAPDKPVLTKIEEIDGSIKITWLANAEQDLKGYNVYRKIKGEEQFAKKNISTLAISTTYYTDRSVEPGIVYQYVIQAIDESGFSSEMSETLSYSRQLKQGNNLMPTKLEATYKQRKGVEVNWLTASTENLVGFAVYRGKATVDLRPISGNISETSFLDKEVEIGENYTYQIRAYTENGEVLTSKEITITIQ